MRSIAILILIYLNIFDDSRWEFLLNVSEIFLRDIKLYLMNDLFTRFYIAIYHNDNDCSKCRQSRISHLRDHLSLSSVTTIIFVQSMNLLLRNEAVRYKMYHEFLLTMTSSIDKHFSIIFLFCMILFIYDLIFWSIVRFRYF